MTDVDDLDEPEPHRQLTGDQLIELAEQFATIGMQLVIEINSRPGCLHNPQTRQTVQKAIVYGTYQSIDAIKLLNDWLEREVKTLRAEADHRAAMRLKTDRRPWRA